MNPFRPVKLACEVRLAALRARAERLSKEIEVAAQAVKMASEAEAKHEALSPSKPRAAVKAPKLTAQVGTNWWAVAVDPGIQAGVERRRVDYTNRPWHSTPGKHDIYYAVLSDLSKIITANSHLFRPVIPDIDQWIARPRRHREDGNLASRNARA